MKIIKSLIDRHYGIYHAVKKDHYYKVREVDGDILNIGEDEWLHPSEYEFYELPIKIEPYVKAD